jgi:hypothetical protein
MPVITTIIIGELSNAKMLFLGGDASDDELVE